MSQARGVLLYHNRDKQTIVTTTEGYDHVKSYLQMLRANAAIITAHAPNALAPTPVIAQPRR
jgi:hypothetical protein